jgi:two-component system chemotaxis response regulator CheB
VRVLVVDDSAVIRGMVTRILEADGSIEVVGSAMNGAVAIEAVRRTPVDVVVLDIEMPVMSGLEALPEIIKARPDVKVVMASTLTRRGAAVSVEALAKGASDFIPKPTARAEISSGDEFGPTLIEKVKALGGAKARRSAAASKPSAGASRPTKPSLLSPTRPIELRKKNSLVKPRIVAIGSSTGGPQALLEVLSNLQHATSIPIVVTQHMPETFTAILAEHIARATKRDCVEGEDGMPLEKGHVYVAPGGQHMTVDSAGTGNNVIRLDRNPPENFCRPAVDPLFRSVAACFGPSTLALILTGMGQDGLEGARSIVEAGGTLVAQDEKTSVVWGMPGAVANAGLCSAILPLDGIADHLGALIGGTAR